MYTKCTAVDWHPIWSEFSQLRPSTGKWLLKMNNESKNVYKANGENGIKIGMG